MKLIREKKHEVHMTKEGLLEKEGKVNRRMILVKFGKLKGCCWLSRIA